MTRVVAATVEMVVRSVRYDEVTPERRGTRKGGYVDGCIPTCTR